MRRLLLLLAFALTLVGVTGTAAATSGSDSSGTHSYTSTCEAGLPHFTNTSDPTSTGNGVIEFRAAGATLTLGPGESGVLDPGEVSPNTPWDVVFFDLGEPYVFDGGTFGICESLPLRYSVSVAEGCNDGEPVVNFTNTGTGTIHATIDSFASRSIRERPSLRPGRWHTATVPAVRLARLRVSRPDGRHRTGVRHRDGVPRQRLRSHDWPCRRPNA